MASRHSPLIVEPMTANSTSGGASEAAAARVIRLTATILGGVWILGLVPALTAEGSGLRSEGLGAALLLVLTAAWVAGLLLRWLPPSVFVGVVAATTIVVALNTEALALSGPYAVLVPWVNFATLMAALSLPTTRALFSIVAIAVSAFVAVSASALSSGDFLEAWRGCVLMAAYPVAVGIAALVTARALIGIARVDDTAAAARLAAVEREERERAGVAERFQIFRLLHDTVINTLGAIREGSSSAHRIQERSRFDLSALAERSTVPAVAGQDRASGEPDPVRSVIDTAQTRAESLGLTLKVANSGTQTDVPRAVTEQMSAAVAEALVNVSKHSDQTSADIRVTGGQDWLEVRVSDPGKGFGRQSFSAPESIRVRCNSVGIEAAARPRVGGGAVIVLNWVRPSEVAPAEDADGVLVEAVIPATRRASICLVSLFVVNTLLVVGVQPVGGAVVGLVVIIAAITWALFAARSGVPVRWYVSLTLVVAAALVAFLPTFRVPGCAAIGISWWGALGSAFCVVVIVLLSGRALWITLGCIGYVIGITLVIAWMGPAAEGCVADAMPSIVLTDVAFVGGMIAFRRMLTTYGARAEQWNSATRASTARAAAVREHERVRATTFDSVLTEVRPLLQGLADGTLEPGDATVRQHCAEEERYLRALLKVDPDLGGLGDAITRALQRAHAHGAVLSVQCAEKVHEPTPDQLAAIEVVVREVVDALPAASEGFLTLFPTRDGASMTIVTPALDCDQLLAADHRGVGGFEVHQSVDEDEMLVELVWG